MMPLVPGQDPGVPAAAVPGDAIAAFQHLGWVDGTALTIITVFVVIGLFQGFLWQVSRVAILVIAYGLASHFAEPFRELLIQWTSAPDAVATAESREMAYYAACVVIFLLTLIALSLVSLLLQHLVRRAGMTFFDRLGGGIVGGATGSVLVLVFLTAVFMFFPGTHVAEAAEASQSFRVSRRVLRQLGDLVPIELQKVFPDAAGRSPPGELLPPGALPSTPLTPGTLQGEAGAEPPPQPPPHTEPTGGGG